MTDKKLRGRGNAAVGSKPPHHEHPAPREGLSTREGTTGQAVEVRAAMTKPPADLLPHSACTPARDWVESAKGTPAQLWRRCPRGDWLLWLAAEVGVDRKLVVMAACDCAEATAARRRPSTSTERWWQGVDATAECLRVVRAWCARRATRDTVSAALCELGASAFGGGNRVDAVEAAASIVAFRDGPYCRRQATEYASRAAQGESNTDSDKRMAALVRKRIPWARVEAKLTRGA